MASLGGSMKKGQTAMVCQLCENDPRMKWKCIDCSLMMCQRCREKVHPKFPGAADHTIMDLKEIGTAAQPVLHKLDFSKIPCENHTGQNACLFCTKCDKLVCPSCVSQVHNKHELIEIKQAYDMKLEFIKNRQTKLESKLKTLSFQDSVLINMRKEERVKFVSVQQQILDYQQKLNEAKNESDDLLSQLDQKWSGIIIFSGNEYKRICNQKNDQRKALEDLSISNDVKGVFSAASNAMAVTEENITSIKINNQQIPKLAVPNFQIPIPKFEQCYIPYQLSLSIEGRWDVDSVSDEIINLIVLENDTFCLNNSYTDVQFLGLDHDNLRNIGTYKTKVLSIARSTQGNILIADGTNCLKMMTSGSGHVTESCFSVSPFNAVSVHARSDGYVIAGLVEPGKIFPIKGVRKVVVMDLRGKINKTFVNDRTGKPLFSAPTKITTNQNFDIGIIDMLSDDYCGRFILLDNEGDVKSIYTGHQSINGDEPFKPTDITCTPCNNFVISEYWHHQLIVFNNEGDLVAYHSTEASPRSIGMINPGQIYLGCKATNDSKNKARIYKLRWFPW